MTISDNDLKALDYMVSKTTTAPWEAVDWDADFDGWKVVDGNSYPGFYSAICDNIRQGHDQGEADAKFIAAARSAVPRLVAEIRRLRSEAQQ